VPTGAIIERGSNANGSYVRFADGTQICSMQRTDTAVAINNGFYGGFSSTPLTWTYPAAFSHINNVSPISEGGGSFGNTAQAVTLTDCSYRYTSVTSAAEAGRYVRIFAIGRWY
jgi:hypothetical protein